MTALRAFQSFKMFKSFQTLKTSTMVENFRRSRKFSSCDSIVSTRRELTAEAVRSRRRASENVILTKPSASFAFSAVKFFSSLFFGCGYAALRSLRLNLYLLATRHFASLCLCDESPLLNDLNDWNVWNDLNPRNARYL